MTKALDTKTKIAIGNHEGDEEKEKGGSQELTNSLLKHYNSKKNLKINHKQILLF